MDFRRKENFNQGSHGVGRHDSGGSFGNYQNYQDKEGRDWKKIIYIIIGLLAVISVIGLIMQNSGGTSVPQNQLDVENIGVQQSRLSLFVEEYEDELVDNDAQAISAHVDAMNLTNQAKLLSYYQANYTSRTSLKVTALPKETVQEMSKAVDFGNFDEIYTETLLSLMQDQRDDIQSLYTTTKGTGLENLETLLEESYDRFEHVDKLIES